MLLNDLKFFEAKRKKRQPQETPSEVLTSTPTEFKIFYAKSVAKSKIKYINKPANIKALDKLITSLKQTGQITGNNAHRIQHEKLHSEYSGKDESGWVIAWLSRTDDLRLAYKKFDDRTIEVKFGKAKDIGYKH